MISHVSPDMAMVQLRAAGGVEEVVLKAPAVSLVCLASSSADISSCILLNNILNLRKEGASALRSINQPGDGRA